MLEKLRAEYLRTGRVKPSELPVDHQVDKLSVVQPLVHPEVARIGREEETTFIQHFDHDDEPMTRRSNGRPAWRDESSSVRLDMNGSRVRPAQKQVVAANPHRVNHAQKEQLLPRSKVKYEATHTVSLALTSIKSIFLKHSWNELYAEQHGRELLITRTQRAMIQLCDVLTGMSVQATFYGKNQFGLRDKAVMVVVSSLCMVPVSFIFPRLFILCNIPPKSFTLSKEKEKFKEYRKTSRVRKAEAPAKLAASKEASKKSTRVSSADPSSARASFVEKAESSRLARRTTSKSIRLSRSPSSRDDEVFSESVDRSVDRTSQRVSRASMRVVRSPSSRDGEVFSESVDRTSQRVSRASMRIVRSPSKLDVDVNAVEHFASSPDQAPLQRTRKHTIKRNASMMKTGSRIDRDGTSTRQQPLEEDALQMSIVRVFSDNSRKQAWDGESTSSNPFMLTKKGKDKSKGMLSIVPAAAASPEEQKRRAMAERKHVAETIKKVWTESVSLQRMVLRLLLFITLGDLFVLISALYSGNKGVAINMSASFSAIGVVLNLYGVYCVILQVRSAFANFMLFECLCATALALCAPFMWTMSPTFSIGLITLVVATLLTLWLLRTAIQLQNRIDKLSLVQMSLRWSKHTKKHHMAAVRIQCAFRTKMARLAIVRAAEFAAWREAHRERTQLLSIANVLLMCLTLFLVYMNLVFGMLFDGNTKNKWLITCALAMLVESVVQQPVVLMISAIIGDFVESGSNVLIDMVQDFMSN